LKKKCATLRIALEKDNKPDSKVKSRLFPSVLIFKVLAQNIDELQCILGELYFTFKEKTSDRDDVSVGAMVASAVTKGRVERDNDDDL
jgi:hypothetical protein